MLSPRKLIEGLALDQAVASLDKELEVPDLGPGVAGDIDDLVGPCGDHLFQGLGVDPLPGRVDHDEVRPVFGLS